MQNNKIVSLLQGKLISEVIFAPDTAFKTYVYVFAE